MVGYMLSSKKWGYRIIGQSKIIDCRASTRADVNSFFCIVLVLCVFVLFSCSSAPSVKPIKIDIPEFPVKQKVNIIEVPRHKIVVPYSDLSAIDKEVDVNTSIPLSLQDFISLVFLQEKINLAYNIDKDILSKKVYVSFYKGSLSNLLNSISRSHGIFFTYQDGILSVSSKQTFIVNLFRYADIDKVVVDKLKALGADNLIYDVSSSKVVFTSDYSAYQSILAYINSISNDFHYVKLRLVMVEYQNNYSDASGLDWHKMIMDFSSVSGGGFFINKSSDSDIISFGIKNGRFNLSNFLHYYKTMGSVDIKQDVVLGLIGSYKGKIDSVLKIPFIDNITVTAASNTASQQGVKLSEVDTGLSLEFQSWYDNSIGKLYIKLDTLFSTLTGFRSLSTGQTGIIVDRPIISKRSLSSYILISPDEIAVVGGMRVNYKDVSYDGLKGIDIGLNKNNIKESEMYIFIEPEITKVKFTE
jgi:hypothetical protein